jgi:ABC-2 type transport system permease protein
MNGLKALTLLEIKRSLRNRRVMFFSVAYPAVLYFAIGKSNHGSMDGIPVGVYYMLAMASFGVLGGSLTNNAVRIAQERKDGWTKQLRLTPMPGHYYVVAKVLATSVVTLPSIAVVFICGAATNKVNFTVLDWVIAGVTIWFGGLIFAALAVAIGYALPHDTVQIAAVLIYMLMSFLGGLFFAVSGGLEDVAKALPTYWVSRVSHEVLFKQSVSGLAYLVLAAWLVGVAALAAWLFRRDTRNA